jgi:hypothetical protein
MNDTLCIMQDSAEDIGIFNDFIASGELKVFKEKPYLLITQE